MRNDPVSPVSKERPGDLVLRRATLDDADRLLAWRNDEATCRYALSPDPVSYSSHLQWLCAALDNAAIAMWIGEVSGRSVAQARLDCENGVAVLDYTVAPEERGKGYGAALLRALQELVRQASALGRIEGVLAQVRAENVASLRALRSCGWVSKGEDGEVIDLWWHG